MARPRNSSSSRPVSEADNKILATILGSKLSHREEIYSIVTIARFWNERLESLQEDSESTEGVMRAKQEEEFVRLCIKALRSGDHDFFSDLGKIVEHSNTKKNSLPVDHLILLLHGDSWKHTMPKGGYSAYEIYAIAKKYKIPCKDIKTVRDAAKRLGIRLRKESPGPKR